MKIVLYNIFDYLRMKKKSNEYFYSNHEKLEKKT